MANSDMLIGWLKEASAHAFKLERTEANVNPLLGLIDEVVAAVEKQS